MTRARPRERGSGTVLVLAVLGAVAIVLATALLALAAMQARGTAQAAADLGALAGAARPWDPCGVARAVVVANRAELAACVVEGAHVRVRTTAPVVVGGRAVGLAARSEAHAGPSGRPDGAGLDTPAGP